MSLFHRVTVLAASVLLTGCFSGRELLERMRPEAEDGYAREFLDLVRSQDLQVALDRLDSSVDRTTARQQFDAMAASLGPASPLSTELIGFHVFVLPDDRRVELTYQLHCADKWFLAHMVVGPREGALRIRGAHLTPIRDSLANINAFTLKDAGPTRFMFLALCTAMPIFILVSLILAFRMRLRRKWLWILFIVVGIAQVSLNWTSGQVSFRPFFILLFGAGMTRIGFYGPWVVSFALPIGAIALWVRRHRLRPTPSVEAGSLTSAST